MISVIIFYLALAVALAIGMVYFRDSGDVSQMVLRVKRENILRFIRNEYRLISIGLGSAAVMAAAHFVFGARPGWVFWIAVLLVLVLYGFP